MWVLTPGWSGPWACSSTGLRGVSPGGSQGGGGWGVVISSDGGSDGGRRIRIDWGLHHKDVEYGCTIYCDANDSGPL